MLPSLDSHTPFSPGAVCVIGSAVTHSLQTPPCSPRGHCGGEFWDHLRVVLCACLWCLDTRILPFSSRLGTEHTLSPHPSPPPSLRYAWQQVPPSLSLSLPHGAWGLPCTGSPARRCIRRGSRGWRCGTRHVVLEVCNITLAPHLLTRHPSPVTRHATKQPAAHICHPPIPHTVHTFFFTLKLRSDFDHTSLSLVTHKPPSYLVHT